MLLVRPTRYRAGVTLWGDPQDLQQLRETIYDLSDEQVLGDELSSFLLGLAYEVRHAHERNRLSQRFGERPNDRVIYRGSQILWPYFLVQISLLRHAAGLQPNTAAHQADLYRLEAETHSALKAVDAGVAEACLELLPHVGRLPRDYLTSFVTVQAREYVTGPGGKARFAKLPVLLRRLLPYEAPYRRFREELTEIAQQHGCHPTALGDPREWPPFRW